MITAVATQEDLAMDGWEEGGSKESESDQLWKLGCSRPLFICAAT